MKGHPWILLVLVVVVLSDRPKGGGKSTKPTGKSSASTAEKNANRNAAALTPAGALRIF